MTTVIVYGQSDDLVEIDGDLREEFGFFRPGDDAKPGYLAFTDGTVLSIAYDETGMWRINRLVEGGAAYSKVEATDPDKNYTDRVTLIGDIKAVVFGDDFHRIKQRGATNKSRAA